MAETILNDVWWCISFVVWVICVEIRIRRLRAYNDFLKDRVAEIDARTYVMEEKAKRNKGNGE